MTRAAAIGLGTWPLGGGAYGTVQRSDAIATLEEAVALGIGLMDTADIYGDGLAESLIGGTAACAGVAVLSKAGYLQENGSGQCFEPGFLRSRIEASLRRLRRSRLDIFLLHSPGPQVLADRGVWSHLAALCDEGLIGAYGASLAHVDHFTLLPADAEGLVVELIFNLLDQRAAENGYFECAQARNWKMIARLPLAAGFLSGKYLPGYVFAEGDSRARWQLDQRQKWFDATARFAFMLEQRTPAQAALAFCLAQPGLHAAIPGAKSPRQFRELVAVNDSALRLSADEFRRARSVWSRIGNIVPQ